MRVPESGGNDELTLRAREMIDDISRWTLLSCLKSLDREGLAGMLLVALQRTPKRYEIWSSQRVQPTAKKCNMRKHGWGWSLAGEEARQRINGVARSVNSSLTSSYGRPWSMAASSAVVDVRRQPWMDRGNSP